MSNIEPTNPYVYQPDGVNSPNYPRIYALSGPGVPKDLIGKRFTKGDAYVMLRTLVCQHGVLYEHPTEFCSMCMRDALRGE